MENKIQENNVSQFGKGLHLDNSHIDTPKGTYKFALNSVNETELGDSGFISNEESNEIASSLTPGFVPIGKVYMGNNENIIFSVSSDETISEIGILDANGKYTAHVNDADVPEKEKLNFKVSQQIQGTYRLRKGCEKTVYFAGKGYPVRYYNFNKPNQFKLNSQWSSSKFGLYKKLNSFPVIDKIEVLDNAGNLEPGSYNILIQHLDEDFNGTEFYELVRNVVIYNDPLNTTYADIDGSANMGDPDTPYKYPKTSKAINIVLDTVDKTYTYVRFAFVEITSGTGQISGVKYSDPISVHNPTYVYTGDNAAQTGTIEEVELFNLNAGIQSAEHIEQIDNMLILANVQGGQEQLCKLQKYASKIQTDCFVKDIILTSVKEDHNSKNPLVTHNGLGYQPGDIYSIGIVYLFEDYTFSPVFPIPGKSPTVPRNLVYSPEPGVYPMDNENNQNLAETYLDENTSCADADYWGKDSEGVSLKNKRVRHHRFPTRDQIGIGFVNRIDTTGGIAKFKKIQLSTIGIPRKSEEGYSAENYNIRVRYKRNGITESFSGSIYPDSNIVLEDIESNIFKDTDVITDIKLYYSPLNSSVETEINMFNNESQMQPNEVKYKVSITQITENNTKHVYQSYILGLKLSNVELPPEEEIGKKVIGYQIVRQERTDNDKNILDSAVVFPMMKSGRNVSTAMLAPEFWTNRFGPASTCQGAVENVYPTCYNISKNNVMLLTPGHKFMDKTYDGFTTIDQVGVFKSEYVARSGSSIQNIYEGSSAEGIDTDGPTSDSDGMTLRHIYRFTGVKYEPTTGTPLHMTNENARMYNLDAVNYAESEDGTETLYNLAFDNKALVLSSNKPGVNYLTYGPGKHHFPYVYIKKNNSTFYQNFRNNPYYYASTEIFYEDTCKVFGGDTHIVPLRHSNHIFGGAAAGMRRSKLSAWKWIVSGVIAIIGIVLAVFTGGTSGLAAVALIGGILMAAGSLATLVSAMVEVQKFNEIYGDKWEANIDRTVFDYIYARFFIREDPHKMTSDKDWEISQFYQAWQDDTLKWFGEAVGDLWFETPLNVSLRVPPTTIENNYLAPLKEYPADRPDKLYNGDNRLSRVEWVKVNGMFNSSGFHRYEDVTQPVDGPFENYFLKKIAVTNSNKPSGLEYIGMSIPQIYFLNPDYNNNHGTKKFYTLPIEYDCCSDCREKFPHRIHYSQQSFQEEKSDNYRMFLPNNYRDIEGETGVITNIFRLYNNLFVHTEEALWQMGRNYQERVTDNVVSFIGTGSYFEIPPQKVLDDNTGSSAGSTHKWGTIKTPAGVFFISENEKKIYQFTGKSLDPISNIGLSNWFRNNLQVNLDARYLKETGKPYPNRDNPSNMLGTGFISTYDSRKERLIFTKKDMYLKDYIYNSDSTFCLNGDDIILFTNISQTIQTYSQSGWIYQGLDNCRMKFKKVIESGSTQTVTTQIWHEPVYETITIEGGSYLNQVCVSGQCNDIKSCEVLVSITDVDGNNFVDSQTVSPGNYWNICIDVGAFVDDDMHTLLVNGEPGYPYQADFNHKETRTETVLIQEGYWETQTTEIPISTSTEIFTYVDGDTIPLVDVLEYEESWTISYSLKNKSWVSWHSYIPNFYINAPEKFYSWKQGDNNIWRHNILGSYQTFYGEYSPHIIEYVSVSNALTTRIWNTIRLQTEAKTYDSYLREYTDDRYTTFNKAILYNTRQCSGEMELVVKDVELGGEDYMMNQVTNSNQNFSVIDRTERDWYINDFRDLRINYDRPIWNGDIKARQDNWYIDKVLNNSTIDINKDWTELESFRDKYLVVRLIFDKFANKKLITNFSVENEQQSFN